MKGKNLSWPLFFLSPAKNLYANFVSRFISSLERYKVELIRYLINPNIFNNLIAEILIEGIPFYYNIKRISIQDINSLFQRIWSYDCYLLENIKENSPTIFDIGAHIGIFSRFVFFKKKNAHLWVFEPDRDNMRILKFNLIDYMNQTEFVEKGIYYKKDRLKLYISKRIDWRSSLFVREDFRRKFPEGEFQESYYVDLTDLDSFVAENKDKIKNIDLIKITIPGMIEHMVLNSGRKTIERFRPQVSVFVYKENKNSVDSFFKEIGYKRVQTKWNSYAEENIKNSISDIWVFVPE